MEEKEKAIESPPFHLDNRAEIPIKDRLKFAPQPGYRAGLNEEALYWDFSPKVKTTFNGTRFRLSKSVLKQTLPITLLIVTVRADWLAFSSS